MDNHYEIYDMSNTFNNTEATYTIKQMSQHYNIPASTLRYYEEIGLLVNVGRTESGQRIYTDEHIRRMDGINCFKNTGLPIAKIQEFYLYEGDVENNIDKIIELVNTHEENTKQQITKMQSDLLHIQQKVRHYNSIKVAIETGTEWPSWSDSAQN